MARMVDLYSLEAWDEAKVLASSLGIEGASLTNCIRSLMRDTQRGQPPSDLSRSYIHSMLKSQLIRSVLYHAAKTFRPEKLPSYRALGQQAFFEIFSGEELAHLLGLYLIYRRLRKYCPPKAFIPMERRALLLSSLGGLLGEAIPAIGLCRGLSIGALPFLGASVFLCKGEDEFMKYRRNSLMRGLELDPSEEMRMWGTTHAHLAASLIQRSGLGVDSASNFVRGLLPSIVGLEECAEEVYRVRISLIWINALATSGKPPDMRHRGTYYPKAEKLGWLSLRTREIKDHGEEPHWLACNEGMISPATHPALFAKEEGTEPAAMISVDEITRAVEN